MRKMEGEFEKTRAPATGGMMCIDGHNVEEEAMMILQHGSMGPSAEAMEEDMEMEMGEKGMS